MAPRFLIVFAFAFLAARCGEPDISTLLKVMEENHLALLNQEHYVIENYFDRREFQAGLIMECTAQDSAPYPQLNEQLEGMHSTLLEMQERRATFYNFNQKVAEKLRISLHASEQVPDSAYSLLEERFESALEEAEGFDRIFRSELTAFDSTIAANGIFFVSHATYADSVLHRIMQWEDSLERQGALMSARKRELTAAIPDKRSEAYRAAYQPLSMMQANHKALEAAILGASNAQDRYSNARESDGFYRGPFLYERPDVDATERIFVKLDSIMAAFRSFDAIMLSSFDH